MKVLRSPFYENVYGNIDKTSISTITSRKKFMKTNNSRQIFKLTKLKYFFICWFKYHFGPCTLKVYSFLIHVLSNVQF